MTLNLLLCFATELKNRDYLHFQIIQFNHEPQDGFN